MMVIVIHGPMACGKTRNAAAFAAHFDCATIHDGKYPSVDAIRDAGGNHLVLTPPEQVDALKAMYRRAPGGVRLIPFASAAKQAGVR